MYRENKDWLRKTENELGELTVQDDINIEIKKVRKQIRKMRKWKCPGPDGILDQKLEQLAQQHSTLIRQMPPRE